MSEAGCKRHNWERKPRTKRTLVCQDCGKVWTLRVVKTYASMDFSKEVRGA